MSGVYHSIIEGTKESLARLQLDYVDVIFAHRSDPNGLSRPVTYHLMALADSFPLVPMEEVVRAFNYVIEKGWVSAWDLCRFPVLTILKAFYWATSEWSAREIEEAHRAYRR